MQGDDGAVARVATFIEDWYAAWQQVRPTVTSMYDLNGMVEAGRALSPLLDEVAARHAVRRLPIGQGTFPLPDATHDPEAEVITSFAVDDRSARVVTTVTRDRGSFHFVYDLVAVGDEWRIEAVDLTLDPPELRPVVGAGTTQLAPPDPGLELDVAGLFRAGREVRLRGRQSAIEVQTPPDWHHTDDIAVWDLGMGTVGAAALAPRAPSGRHRVEVAQAFGRNAAVRVTFRPAPAATWHPAGTVAVDTGTVSLLDVAHAVALQGEVERALVETARSATEPARPLVVPLGLDAGTMSGLLVSSGWGDGGYPVMWGADAQGEVVALLVDFLVLAESIEAEVRTPFSPGAVEHEALARAGMAFRVEAAPGGWRFVGTRTGGLRMRVEAPDGAEVLDGERLGVLQQGDTWTQTWTPAVDVPAGSVLTLRFSTGYRHV